MKFFHKLLLLISIVSCTTLPHMQQLNPANTIIASDLDEVLIQKSLFLTIIGELKNLMGDYKKDPDGVREELTDKQGHHIAGITFHLLYHGMRKPYLTSHVAWLLKYLEKSRRFIDGTAKIYHYLHDVKGYTIVFATNKDRISYDITAQAFGAPFTDLASKVFVAHPGNSPEFLAQLQKFADLPTTPQSYKQLLHTTLTIQPTQMILHAPGRKPERAYYEYVEQMVGKDKNIIFIDDKASNIEGFKDLQRTSSAQRIGIVFKDPVQLAQEFVDLGILSEVDDKELLEEIRYPGIWGKIKGMLTHPSFYIPNHSV